jgi:hypothetical protein
MGAYLADALRRRLARQEGDGDTEGAKATKKRLQAVEKAEAAEVVVDEPKAAAKAETTTKEK